MNKDEPIDIILLKMTHKVLCECAGNLIGAQNLLTCDLFGNMTIRKNYTKKIAPIKKLLSTLIKEIKGESRNDANQFKM